MKNFLINCDSNIVALNRNHHIVNICYIVQCAKHDWKGFVNVLFFGKKISSWLAVGLSACVGFNLIKVHHNLGRTEWTEGYVSERLRHSTNPPLSSPSPV